MYLFNSNIYPRTVYQSLDLYIATTKRRMPKPGKPLALKVLDTRKSFVCVMKDVLERIEVVNINCYTGRSKATVTNDFSLANPKNKRNGLTQSFLESLYAAVFVF